MEIEKDGKNRKYYKIKLCDLYEKNKKCYRGDNCSYAHGKEELKDFKKICNFGLNCFKKDCHFTHPDNWNPEDKKNNPNFEIFINGVKYIDNIEKKDVIEVVRGNIKIDEKMNKEFDNTYISKNYKKENIEELIYKLQNDFEKYTKDIKNNIDNIFIESEQKYGIDMKIDLNKIMAEISLFKNNYQEIIKHYNN